MKQLRILMILFLFSVVFTSCRESTEVNTDGNMEESDSRTEMSEENE